nr:MAG TPA: hypothetical protein [Caudoviricetes sp.]
MHWLLSPLRVHSIMSSLELVSVINRNFAFFDFIKNGL